MIREKLLILEEVDLDKIEERVLIQVHEKEII
jgi:hypothetical protein